jgi:hypothetical protein
MRVSDGILNHRDAKSAEISIRRSSLGSSRLCGFSATLGGTGLGRVLLAVSAIRLMLPSSAHACAACYGQSDSPLASGVTWGILSLLVVVMGVLGSIVTFFVYINKKSAAAPISAGPISDYPSTVTNH